MYRFHAKELVRMALMTALLSVFSLVAIPLGPIPITLQTAFFLFIPAVLGARNGFISIGLYLMMGLLGLPVFAGGAGGLQHIFTPSFGYLLGACLSAPMIGKGTTNGKSFWPLFRMFLLGLGLIYAVGIGYAYWVMHRILETPVGWGTLIFMNLTTFLPLDLIKATIAAWVYLQLPNKYKTTASQHRKEMRL